MKEDLTHSRILIIEDNPSNVDQLEQLLELNGFEHHASLTDSRQAEEKFKAFNPDLILLDLHMPYVDGFEVLEIIQQNLSDDDFLPVIVLTADINPESRERSLKLGAMDFLNKPYDFTETILRITNLLRTRHLHLQLQNYNDLLETKVQERTAELKKFQGELVAQERYKAMGQMASGIVHDFSNVIAVMMGHSELYLSFPDLLQEKERLKETFQNINTAAEDASSIVRHLREFYRSYSSEDEKVAYVELDVAVRGAVSLTRPKWRDQAQSEGRHIYINLDVDDTKIRMSPSNTREILTNLLFNAVDAMPDGGQIHIRGYRKDAFGIIEVQDTGTGMTEEVKRRCLEMFYSTKGEKGSGLGLGMVHELVRKHRGQLEVESEPDNGTTFRLLIPIARGTKEESIEGDTGINRSLNVLLVDDDQKVRDVIATFLLQDGHLVTEAANGRDGLVSFFADQFDLVITDQAMPLFNGEQMIQSIRKKGWNGPFIMMSGFADQMKENGDAPKEANIILSKPVQLAVLRKTILQQCGESPVADPVQ